ncbi:ThiF family adenylyltransferase [Staphylococcus edaphicus]|uniref:ThiF family adenylyltransferase n=1 Tax=Staphylococcus edaphicus TaxID=1955013 RepID=A0A2C6U8I4_9STAP|nr:ThiF family adenylyltransferase [Staphylococcus edaphicus]PHK50112.1 thiamine/molybdopterin biosynthesis protein [Staphylococcus edaphicus]UQW81608.1 ThiF family adenylyltransferase [Staphylococcus edaphicus]
MNERYSRQIRYNAFSEYGQEQLQKLHVMIMGVGALGSHSAEMLVRMGVGRLTVIDMDIVDESNLHRQATYDESDVAHMLPKVEALKAHLNLINSNVAITALNQELTTSNIEAILYEQQPDIVLDGMDHFEIRFLINEICYKCNVPWIYGAAVGSKGTVFGIDYQGPCLKCMLRVIPTTGESCSINGVLPPNVSQVANMQVSELIRWVAGDGFSQKIMTFDCFNLKFNTFNAENLKDTQCPICVHHNYELLNTQQKQSVEALCGDVFLFRLGTKIFELVDYLPLNVTKSNHFVKLANYGDYTMTIFKDGRTHVYGIEDHKQAETIYHQLLKAIK